MPTLLSIERNFLRTNESVREHLSLQAVESLLRTLKNGQKAKFAKSIELSKLVYQGFEWFKTDECRALLNEEGISWTAEDFFSKVYGWQKSFGYKMTKAGAIVSAEEDRLTAFNAECDRVEHDGETANRTIEGFLSYCRAVIDAENEPSATDSEENEGPDVTRPQTVFTLSWKRTGEGITRGVSIRITADGTVITRNEPEEIAAAIAFLQDSLVTI